jgi:hypothetical protein
MTQHRIGTRRTGGLTWQERLGAVLATLLAAGVAVGAAAVGLLVGLVALILLIPLAALGVLRLRRLTRRAAVHAAAPSRAGHGRYIEGEFEVIGDRQAPPDPRDPDRAQTGTPVSPDLRS